MAYSGSMPSIRLNTLSTRLTSITRPRPVPIASRCHTADSSPIAAYSPARSSLIEMPQRGGGRSVRAGGMRGQVAHAADRLADRAERRLVAIRAVLAVAGDARDHQPRVDRVQRRPARASAAPAGRRAGSRPAHRRARPASAACRDRCFRSSSTDSLLRPWTLNHTECPSTAAPQPRNGSPPGGSTLITSAPRSARMRVQNGAAM